MLALPTLCKVCNLSKEILALKEANKEFKKEEAEIMEEVEEGKSEDDKKGRQQR